MEFKMNYRRLCVWLGIVILAFCQLFLIPFATKDRPTKLAKWKVTSERFGFGYPYGFITTGLGKSDLGNTTACTSVCYLYKTQLISFGPLYYERKLEAYIDSPVSPQGDFLEKRERDIAAAFEEIQ